MDLAPLRGQRVAVLSTGSLAVRLVPRLVGEAGVVKLFQRDPGWVVPRIPLAGLWRRMPRLAAALGRAHLRLRVHDREARDRLTPTGDVARPAPRPRVSRSFYRLVDRGDLELIAWPVAGIRSQGVQTADGLEHRVDVIVLA